MTGPLWFVRFYRLCEWTTDYSARLRVTHSISLFLSLPTTPCGVVLFPPLPASYLHRPRPPPLSPLARRTLSSAARTNSRSPFWDEQEPCIVLHPVKHTHHALLIPARPCWPCPAPGRACRTQRARAGRMRGRKKRRVDISSVRGGWAPYGVPLEKTHAPEVLGKPVCPKTAIRGGRRLR